MNSLLQGTDMRPLLIASAVILSILMLSACGGGKKEDSQVTETRMDDIDSLEGTISDDMINTDESTEAGPFDDAPSVGPMPKAEVSAEAKDKSEEVTDQPVDDEVQTE